MVDSEGTQMGGPTFSTKTESVHMSVCCLAISDYSQNAAACDSRVESRLAYSYEAETNTCFEEIYETTIMSTSVNEFTVEMVSEEMLASRRDLGRTDYCCI